MLMARYFNGPGPANSFNVFFYYDNGGFPGMQVWSGTLLGDWLQNGSTFTINLPMWAGRSYTRVRIGSRSRRT